jgi:hypothetical protein
MNPAIQKLEEYISELQGITRFQSVEEKANHIGLINRIETAIGNLKLCEKYEIYPGSLVNVLPETENPNFVYLVVHENESSDPCNWEEVLFNDRQVLLSSGDLVIRK